VTWFLGIVDVALLVQFFIGQSAEAQLIYGIGWGEMTTRGVPYIKFKFSCDIYHGPELPPVSELSNWFRDRFVTDGDSIYAV